MSLPLLARNASSTKHPATTPIKGKSESSRSTMRKRRTICELAKAYPTLHSTTNNAKRPMNGMLFVMRLK